jgi:two-component system NtrC family sensor kinase
MKVLIAEDDGVSQRILRAYLEKWGYEVVVACDGDEAWTLFQQDDFPLVITDWMMPGMDGVDLIRRIRECDRPSGYVYTMLVTARTQKEDLVEGMDAGADDFVTKPFDRDELRVRLREGERVVRLERAVAEQNRELREIQASLVRNDQAADVGQAAAEIAGLMNVSLAAAGRKIDLARQESAKVESTQELARLLDECLKELDNARRHVESLKGLNRS